MRLPVLLGSLIALLIAVAGPSTGIPGAGGVTVALASSGNAAVTPNPQISAWNGDQTGLNISAQSVVTTTMCLTDPNNPASPQAPCGLGAFAFDISWDPALASYVSISGGAFLGSTGRGTSCSAPTVGASSVHFQCFSLGAAPLGPQGSGVLATLILDPHAPAPGVSSTVTLSNVGYTDITGQPFPASGVNGTLEFGPCTDVSDPSDGLVDLSDTLLFLDHFGESPPSAPKYDPNADGGVDLSDALYSLQEYGQSCVAP